MTASRRDHVLWDGRVGFPGGTVEPGESLIQGVCREVREEIGLNCKQDRIESLCGFAGSDRNIHCFQYELEHYDSVGIIIAQATRSEHFLTECQGMFAVQIAEFDNGFGYGAFRRNHMTATALMELDFLVKTKGWL